MIYTYCAVVEPQLLYSISCNSAVNQRPLCSRHVELFLFMQFISLHVIFSPDISLELKDIRKGTTKQNRGCEKRGQTLLNLIWESPVRPLSSSGLHTNLLYILGRLKTRSAKCKLNLNCFTHKLPWQRQSTSR